MLGSIFVIILTEDEFQSGLTFCFCQCGCKDVRSEQSEQQDLINTFDYQ